MANAERDDVLESFVGSLKMFNPLHYLQVQRLKEVLALVLALPLGLLPCALCCVLCISYSA